MSVVMSIPHPPLNFQFPLQSVADMSISTAHTEVSLGGACGFASVPQFYVSHMHSSSARQFPPHKELYC
jgi:hypothetical protein